MGKEVRKFVYLADTRRTRKFQEIPEKGKATMTGQAGIQYVSKEFFDGELPEEITITVEW
ncbi:hypothetical protein DRQ26_05295 [bacterium]|nr:MAG: hypothetical protein DRQ26_05295 [bacterium]